MGSQYVGAHDVDSDIPMHAYKDYSHTYKSNYKDGKLCYAVQIGDINIDINLYFALARLRPYVASVNQALHG